MARYKEPTDENLQAWREWTASRPEAVRLVAERYDPWTLYTLPLGSGSKKLCRNTRWLLVFSLLCRVVVTGEFNLVTHERSVFGIDPDDLEECDLPGADEPLGSLDLPIEVLKDLMTRYPRGAPLEVMADLFARYPLRTGPQFEED
jgi:hypothetical protein